MPWKYAYSMKIISVDNIWASINQEIQDVWNIKKVQYAPSEGIIHIEPVMICREMNKMRLKNATGFTQVIIYSPNSS